MGIFALCEGLLRQAFFLFIWRQKSLKVPSERDFFLDFTP